MDKNNVYDKLTESARKALFETQEEFTEMIIDKAYQYAKQKNTADQEISLSDIIEAKEEILYKRLYSNKQESKKKRMMLMLSLTGAIYAVFGILFYLFQNMSFDITNDLGLLIAALGILISIVAFIYSQLLYRRKVESFGDNAIIKHDNAEFEIVRRWQIIEKLGRDLMLQDGISDDRAQSINSIIKYLSNKLSDNSKTDQLRELLMTRNRIVHSGDTMSKAEIEKMITIADEIIDELENQAKKFQMT